MINEEVIATKPQGFSTAHKSLIFLAAILLTALFSGIGGYLLGVRTNRFVSRPLTRDAYQPSPATIPFSIPVIPLPPVTPGWKLLQSTEMHFTIQYPSTLSLDETVYNPGARILFDSHNPNGRNVGLAISYAPGSMSNGDSKKNVLFNAPIGDVPTENIEGYSDNIITKIADLTINAHRAVHATFFRKGGIYQEPRFCESYIVQKDSSSDYLLDACTTNTTYEGAKAEVAQYSSLMEQIVNTFTIY